LGTDLFKSVLMYSNGAICLIKLLFKMGLFTVYFGQYLTEYELLPLLLSLSLTSLCVAVKVCYRFFLLGR
jgi:hypothetical protein